MITVYLTDEAGTLQIFTSGLEKAVYDSIVPRSWVYLVEPTEEEIQKVSIATKIDESILRKALDEEESAHIDTEGDVRIVVVDTPVFVPAPHYAQIHHFLTVPLSILFNKDFIITACVRKDQVVPSLIAKTMKMFSTAKHFKLTIQLLYRNASIFVTMLKQLNKESELIQSRVQEALKNAELFELMNLGKSVVFLSTGLNSDLIVMERLQKTEEFRQFPDDVALIDDAIIENRQAIEMCSIHREILNGTMDAYASIISNNVNNVMKTLTVVTIVMTIPMIISSFFGMNVDLPVNQTGGFWLILIMSILLSVVFGVFLSQYTSKLKYEWTASERALKKAAKKKK